MANSSLKRGEKILFGVFALIGVFAIASLVMLEVVRAHMDKPMYPTTTHYDFSSEGLRGSTLFRKYECTDCHRALRNGTNMGLDLDGIGSRRSFQYLIDFLKKPEATYQSRTVDHGIAPKRAAFVAELPEEDLRLMAVFLSELRADPGSPAAQAPVGPSGFIDEMVKVWAPSNWKSEFKDVREEGKENSNEDGHDATTK
jgi:hypothetical protein